MRRFVPALATGACALGFLFPDAAAAQHWALWADTSNGLRSATYPVLAIAPTPRRDIYFSFMVPIAGSTGLVYRARMDDPARRFTAMPGFALPTPAAGMGYYNVYAMVTTRGGDPVVGLNANGRSDNADPLLMTWDERAGQWFRPTVTPANASCTHAIYRLDRAPNGDIWAVCQWRGAFVSTDDGRSFAYLDVNALLHTRHPRYFPTRAGGVDYLGALFGLAVAPDGTVYVGSETGGLVQTSDRGATWSPVDDDYTNPMSGLARATNSGDDYGVGVMRDGRVVFQGYPGDGPYPPEDAKRLYLVDRAARTVTVARGIPDYFLGGRLQFASVPGGIFFHSNHDTVNPMTGAPQPGGIFRSTHGVDWEPANEGIDESLRVPGMNVWVDGNGRGASGGFALDGDDLYTVSASGKIFRWVAPGAAPADAGVDVTVAVDVPSDVVDATSTVEDASRMTDDGPDDVVTSDAHDAPSRADTPSTLDRVSTESPPGCACRANSDRRTTRRPLALLALFTLAWAARRRRARRGVTTRAPSGATDTRAERARSDTSRCPGRGSRA